MNEDKEYNMRDKPAERGITMTNVLLAIIMLGGTAFGVIASQYMDSMDRLMLNMNNAISLTNSSILMLDKTVANITSQGMVTANEMRHINDKLNDCHKFHDVMEKRMDESEQNIQILKNTK